MQIQCPPLSDALMRYLDAAFPDHAVDPSKTDPAVAFGQASVVRHLRAVKQAQEEDPDVSAED